MLGLALAALAFASCGGGDSSDQSAGSTTDTVAGTSGASGTSGTTGAAPRGTTPSNGETSDSGGSAAPSSGSAGAGGDSNSSGASGQTGAQNKGSTQNKKKKKPTFAPGSFVGQKDELYKQSKQVCNYLTLDGLAKEYNVTPKTPEAVAQRYARVYPAKVRNAVYRGCKAGLSS